MNAAEDELRQRVLIRHFDDGNDVRLAPARIDRFDLLDLANTTLLAKMYPEFSRFILESGKSLPKNEAAPGILELDKVLRKLDCAVVNWSLDELKNAGRSY